MPSQLSKFPFDQLVVRANLTSAESSTTIDAGKLVYIDASAGTIKLAGADDPLGPIGVAEESIAAGASGYVLFRGYTTLIDLNGLTAGDILAPASSGGVAAVSSGDQKRRIAQVLVVASDQCYFNGFNL